MKLIYTTIKNIQMNFVHVCPRVSCGSLQQHMENCGSWSLTCWPPLVEGNGLSMFPFANVSLADVEGMTIHHDVTKNATEPPLNTV